MVYGTRWGGTLDVAQQIGDALKAAGYEVDTFEAREGQPRLAYYDLIIVGSGIRADQWTKAALKFLERNAEDLKLAKTALFVSCQMADREEEAQQKAKRKYLFEIAEKYDLSPISLGFFGGFVDFKKSHGIIVDVIVRINRKKLLAKGLDIRKVYDTRKWDDITAWAREIAKVASEKTGNSG